MSKLRDFYDKPFFSIPAYIYNLFLAGFYFILCNILLLAFYTATLINPDAFNILLLFISLLPFGPALGALYSTMGELYREKTISVTSYYFSSYKNNFKDNMKLWIVQLSILLLLVVDFQLFYFNMPQFGLHIVVLLLAIFVLVIGLYAFPINSRFKLKLKDLVILSFYYSIKRFPVTLLKIAIVALVVMFSYKIPGPLLLFVPSLLCFLFMLYDNSVFKAIENQDFAMTNNKFEIKK